MAHSIGKTIAELRKAKGWTQIELAEKLNVSDKAVSKWESEGGFPEITQLPVLAKIFDVSIDYLMTGKETEPEIIEKVEEVTEPVTEEPTEEIAEEVTEVATENVEKPTEPKKEETKPKYVSLGEFKLTAYCDCMKCCNKTDGITASGTKATQGRTIAVDPKKIPYGTKIIINGNTYVAEDCGGSIKGNRIDIFFYDHQDAWNFGIQYAEVFRVVK